MREFRIGTDSSSDRRETLRSWGTPLSPIAIVAVVVFISSLHQRGEVAFRWLWPLMIFGTVIGAYVVAFRLGSQRAKRGMIFALSDNELIRRRSGWPDDRIAFSEIDGLYERPSGLVVESTEPLRRISIPREADGFEVIRAELGKHHSLSVNAKPSRTKLSGTGLVVAIVSILSWAAVIFICYEVMRRW